MGNQQSIEAIATRFVNLRGEARFSDFLREYSHDIRPVFRNVRRLVLISRSLRDAWGNDAAFSTDIIEGIFFETTVRVINGRPYHVASDSDPFSHPAFKVRLGESELVFKRRDVLDDIAHAILKASARGLLRKCRGHQRGWDCPTPLLVADEKRRVYCYMRCGDHSKSLSRLRWWRKNRSGSAKARQKSNLRASSRRGKAA